MRLHRAATMYQTWSHGQKLSHETTTCYCFTIHVEESHAPTGWMNLLVQSHQAQVRSVELQRFTVVWGVLMCLFACGHTQCVCVGVSLCVYVQVHVHVYVCRVYVHMHTTAWEAIQNYISIPVYTAVCCGMFHINIVHKPPGYQIFMLHLYCKYNVWKRKGMIKQLVVLCMHTYTFSLVPVASLA